jgi:hypothetical protein
MVSWKNKNFGQSTAADRLIAGQERQNALPTVAFGRFSRGRPEVLG